MKNSTWKRKIVATIKFVVLLLIALSVYVYYVNRHSTDMTFRQKLLKAFYPVLMLTGKAGKHQLNPPSTVKAPVSFHTLEFTSINGKRLPMASASGKKILLVNTASDCGYTAQLAQLQQLHERHGQQIMVIGFPSSDFKNQERGSNEDIAAFCSKNFGVDFLLAQKGQVIPGEKQQPVYQWLSSPTLNGWNQKHPEWNFSKFIVDENGNLTHYFGPSVNPLGKEIKSALGIE